MKSLKEIICFGLIGLGNTLFGIVCIYIYFDIIGLGYWASTALAYGIGGILSFFLNRNLTFNSKGIITRQIMKFFVNMLICYLTGYGLARVFVKYIVCPLVPILRSEEDRIAIMCGMGLYILFNYIGQKFWCFNDKRGL